MELFSTATLVAFGNFLLSDERNENLVNKENARFVHDADLANFFAENPTKTIESDKDFNGLLSVGKGTFGMAIEAVKHGKKIARQGWNGKGMFAFMVNGSKFQVSRAPLNEIYPEGTEVEYRPHIDLKAADGTIGVWNPNMMDILAEDWQIVE